MIIPPGSVIGIIGGGQLGRMLSIAAAQLGYPCHIFDPHERPCAADVAAHLTRADFDDAEALARFGAEVDVATYEFENLPVGPLEALGEKLKPGTRSLAIAQDRALEKTFIEESGGRGRKICAATVRSPESAVMSKAPDRYTHQNSSLQLFLHTHTRYKCQPYSLLHEPLDGLDRRKLECDV